MKIVNCDDSSFCSYNIINAKNNSKGNIVFIHGTNVGGMDSFKNVITDERLSDYNLIIPNYGGCSDSSLPKDLSIRGFAEQIISILKDTKKDNFIIIGVSLGSLIAAYLAAKYSDLINKNILTACWQDNSDSRFRMVFNTWLNLTKLNNEYANALGISHAFSYDFLSSLNDEILAKMCNSISKDIDSRIEVGLNANISKEIKKITKPTLIIGLKKDTLIPINLVKKVHTSLPKSIYEEINSGHAVQVENPKDWVSLILDFINK